MATKVEQGNMVRQLRLLLPIAILLVILRPCLAQQIEFGEDLKGNLSSLLESIPEVAETVMVACAPFEKAEQIAKLQETASPGELLQASWRTWTLGPLTQINDGSLLREAIKKNVSLTMECAWELKYPRDIGVGDFNGFHLILLRDAVLPDDQLMKAIISAPTETRAGVTWYRFDVNGKRPRFYLTVAHKQVLVVARSLEASDEVAPWILGNAPRGAKGFQFPTTDIEETGSCFAWSRYEEHGSDPGARRTIELICQRDNPERISIHIRGNLTETDDTQIEALRTFYKDAFDIAKYEGGAKIEITLSKNHPMYSVLSHLVLWEWVGHHTAL